MSLIEKIRLSQNESENGHTAAATIPKSRQNSSDETYSPNEKPTRFLKIGWMLNGKTAREKNGGGVRTVSVSKTAKRQYETEICVVSVSVSEMHGFFGIGLDIGLLIVSVS